MKKILILCFALITTTNISFAKTKDYLYVVKNATPIQTTKAIYNELNKSKVNDLKLDETNNVVYTKNGDLYFKTYKYDSNSELYVVTDTENSEDIIKSIDYHKQIICSCDSILNDLNPEYAEKQ